MDEKSLLGDCEGYGVHFDAVVGGGVLDAPQILRYARLLGKPTRSG